MHSSGFMERFNDSDQRGVLDMHGFGSLREAGKQTGRRLAGCRQPIETAWTRRANTSRVLRSTHQHACPFLTAEVTSPDARL